MGLTTSLPLWTATAAYDAEPLLFRVHKSYVDAGAEILTANTFRTNRYTLQKASRAAESTSLTRKSIDIAKAAATGATRKVWVAGSLAPLEDCYQPQLTPIDAVLRREHEHHAQCLAEQGAELVLVETMPTGREALIAARAALETGLPVIVSLLVAGDCSIYDSTSIESLVTQLARLPLTMLCLNCGPASSITQALPLLRASNIPFGAYANAGRPDGSFGKKPEALDADDYACEAAKWLATGAQLIGGCCGTSAKHISRLRQLIDSTTSNTTR
jgi:methionine synthase I (cobalamin-dependent)